MSVTPHTHYYLPRMQQPDLYPFKSESLRTLVLRGNPFFATPGFDYDVWVPQLSSLDIRGEYAFGRTMATWDFWFVNDVMNNSANNSTPQKLWQHTQLRSLSINCFKIDSPKQLPPTLERLRVFLEFDYASSFRFPQSLQCLEYNNNCQPRTMMWLRKSVGPNTQLVPCNWERPLPLRVFCSRWWKKWVKLGTERFATRSPVAVITCWLVSTRTNKGNSNFNNTNK